MKSTKTVWITNSHNPFSTQQNSRLPGSNLHHNLRLLHAIKLYTDVQYYILVSPFRLQFDFTTNKFKVVQNFSQKLVTIILILLDAIWWFGKLRAAYPENSLSSYQVVIFICYALWLILIFKFISILWSGKHRFQTLVNFIATAEFDLVSSKPGKVFFSKRFQIGCLCFQVAFFLHRTLTELLPPDYSYSRLNLADWTTALLRETQSIYFINSVITANDTWIATDYFVASIGIISHLHSFTFNYRILYLVLLFSMTLWTGAASYSVFLDSSDRHSWKTVKRIYDVIFDLSAHINNCISTLPLWYSVMLAFFYSFQLKLAMVNQNVDIMEWTIAAIRIFWFVTEMSIFLICGNACSKVTKF